MRKGVRILLWFLAVLLAAGVGFHQRRTGPTWPLRASFAAEGVEHSCRLPRAGITGRELAVTLPRPGAGWTGDLLYKRWPTGDPFRRVPLRVEGDRLAAGVPSQPPAGKVEYRIELRRGEDVVVLPACPGPNPIARFKGDVPAAALIPHIAAMFLALVLGLRAGLGSLLAAEGPRLAVLTLAALTLGGLVLGPIVQKHAFGEYWTGWPLGGDLTDSKTLVMWGLWLAAVVAPPALRVRRDRARRLAVGLAAVLTLAVYLIPHSARGSQLDYDKLDRGVSPREAVETGRAPPATGPRARSPFEV